MWWRSLALASPPPVLEPRVGLDAVALVQIRTSTSNLVTTNPLLDGQVVGAIGGASGVVVDPTAVAAATEQRVGLFTRYAPRLLDGRASLNGAFEIDFAWGDSAYGTGGNVGGGFGGDQVNLQTRRLSADVLARRGIASVRVEAGLQWLGDSELDPAGLGPDALFHAGAHGMLFASEAAGVVAYGRLADAWGTRFRGRLGLFTLSEQGFTVPDDVWVMVADASAVPGWRSSVGVHVAWMQDRSGGTGGALGQGPVSPLSALQGGPSLDLYDGAPVPPDARADADLVWLFADVGYNPALGAGALGATAMAGALVGRLYAPLAPDDGVLGFFGDAELRWRWTQGAGSVARVETLVTSGDDPNPDSYTGLVTGNSYGVAGAVYATHGMLLLFPDRGAINRLVSVVPDSSNAGRGLRAVTAGVGLDLVPDRLTTSVGLGTATDAATVWMGTELNAAVVGRPLWGMDLGLRGAVLFPGPDLTGTPWTALLTLDWLVTP